RQPRLYPLLPDQKFADQRLHALYTPVEGGYKRKDLDVNLYHLKMIEPENRVRRAELFNRLDPEKRFQKIGYDYLADETGMRLEAIPAGREFAPAYRK